MVAAVASPAQPSAEHRPVVIAVDDEPQILELIVRLLRPGHEVHPFSDPLLAVKEAPALKPDLVLSDYRMPGLTGIDMVRKMRALGLDFSAVLVTGYADLDEVTRALNEKVVSWVVTKPFRSAELKAQVELSLGLRKLKAIQLHTTGPA